MRCKDISIIVPVAKDNELLHKLLDSVIRQVCKPGELLLVLDGMNQPILLQDMPFPARVILNEGPPGAASARNTGARVAQTEWLFFLDSDVIATDDLVEKASVILEKDPVPVAWIGSYDDQPSATNFISRYKNLFNHIIHQQASTEAFTFWGACGLIKRSIFLEQHGFNEQYRKATVEDIELGYRLRKGGYSIQLEKSLQVKHQKKWTFGSLLYSDIFDRAIPWSKLLLQYGYAGRKDLNLKNYARISFLLVLLLIAALITTFFYPLISICTGVTAIILLLFFNRILYRFYAREGPGFLVRAIGMHWLYYFYSGLSFLYAGAVFYLSGKKR